ncbi:MAG: ester cyclase [Rhodobiaceae bacterium]|nr:ester cyclase [Rhodobiaceae bacterium]
MTTNEQIVRDACRIIWSEGDVSRVEEFYAPTYKANYPFGEGWGNGVEGVRDFATAIRNGYPDYHEEIEDIVVDNNKVAVRLRITGTHTGEIFGIGATGKRVDFRDMTIVSLKDGKIIEQAGLSDNLTLFAQLGVLELPGAMSPPA